MVEKKMMPFDDMPNNIRIKAERLEKVVLSLKEIQATSAKLEEEKKLLVDDISKFTQEKDIDLVVGSKIQIARQYRETVSLKKEFKDEAMKAGWAERKFAVTFVTTLRKIN